MKSNYYHIITIGCQMNKSDSERIAGLLENLGWILTEKKEQAGLIIINTCGVRQSAEDRVYGLIPKIKKENKKAKIILTGCLANRKDAQKRLKDAVDLWLPINKITRIQEAIIRLIRPAGKQISNEFLNPKSKSVVLMQNKKLASCEYLNIKPKYNSKISAFVPIGNGCDNFCSYCVVPYARGREVYRPAEEIVEEVKNLVKDGYKEINLIAQNVNSYKARIRADKKTNSRQTGYCNFVDLLNMINNIRGDFWIRFTTSHPKDMSDELIKAVAALDKVCEHIHLPAQSGDDIVLRNMNRKYKRKDYIKLVKKIKSRIKLQTKSKISNSKNSKLPSAISTDIIVGFPEETGKQFANTKKLFREAIFDLAYIAQYSPRPGTAAFKLKDDVAKQEKKKREEELMKILRKTALANNKEYLGKIVEVLVEGKNKKGDWLGKTRTNKYVKIEAKKQKIKNKNLAGKFVKVKIKKARDFGLEGAEVEK